MKHRNKIFTRIVDNSNYDLDELMRVIANNHKC